MLPNPPALAPDATTEALRKRLLARTAEVATGGATRLWRTGRMSASLARTVAKAARDGRVDVRAVEEIVGALGDLKGVGMKVGQMLSYLDPTLPEEMRAVLALLQTSAAATATDNVKREVVSALGAERGRVLADALEESPIAVASIGQVHRAQLPDGTRIAVKVLHPGIRTAIANELLVAGKGAAVADAIVGNVSGFVAEARSTLLDECDYTLEAENQRELARAFAGDPVIVIPDVLSEWCARDVLVTRFMAGRSLDEIRSDPPLRDAIGAALFRFHLGALYGAGLFHADPHPGNYAVTHDGHLIVYDFGCVRRFTRTRVEALARLAEAARTDDVSEMHAALIALGARPPASAAAEVRRFVRGFFGPLLSQGAQAIAPDAGLDAQQVMRDKRALHRLALPPQMLFLFRLRFGLYAVLSRLGAVADWSSIEHTLARAATLRA